MAFFGAAVILEVMAKCLAGSAPSILYLYTMFWNRTGIITVNDSI